MPITYNDHINTRADLLSPPTSPTLKLARHGGGTLGGPVKLYTSNPFSFFHHRGEVTATPTVLTDRMFGQPEHAMVDEIRAYRYNVDLSDRMPNPGGYVHPGGAGGQFVWPDTSIGSAPFAPRMGAVQYGAVEPTAQVAKPQTFWERLVGLVAPRGK